MVDINDIIRETVELVGTRQERQGNRVDFQAELKEGSLPAMVDPQELRQVLWNLCVNSVESMKQGGILKISTRLQNNKFLTFNQVRALRNAAVDAGDGEKNSYVEIVVEDTGEGISDKEMQKIFDPFFTTKEAGTGLGLAIAYRIIEKHDGLIDVESEIGKGTRMHVFIPVFTSEPSGVDHSHQP